MQNRMPVPVRKPIWRRPVKSVTRKAKKVAAVVTAPTTTARPELPAMTASAGSISSPLRRSST